MKVSFGKWTGRNVCKHKLKICELPTVWLVTGQSPTQCNLGRVLKRNKTNRKDRKNRWRTGLNPGIHLIKTVDSIKTDYDNKIKQCIIIC